MPLGALLAGPLAAAIGVSTTQFAAAAVIVVASALTLIPREIWTIRFDDVQRAEPLADGSASAVAEPASVPIGRADYPI
jgi:hypothetical protein